MTDEISTHHVKAGYSTVEDIVLVETARTRTVLRPAVHLSGVRGALVRQKVSSDGLTYLDSNDANFTTLPNDYGVAIELDTAAMRRLYEHLSRLYAITDKGVERQDKTYVVAPADRAVLLDSARKAQMIQMLVDADDSEELWTALARARPDLVSRLAAGQIQADRQESIRFLERSIREHPADEAFWQKFFESRAWMLQAASSCALLILNGETYLGGKMPQGRQGVGGVATDFLAADDSTKSFACVEIKTPSTALLGPRYRGESGSSADNETYSIHTQLSGAIVQVRNQITVAVNDFHSVLGRAHPSLNCLHPKGVLVAGTSETLSQRQRWSLNQFREGQFSLTVITFDELLRRLRIMYDVPDS